MAARRRNMAVMPILSLLALATTSNAATSKGCFSSSEGLTDLGSWPYQSTGYCQPLCLAKGAAVFAMSGLDCYCGSTLPAADTLVDNSKCTTKCGGFPDDTCGGPGLYSLYLTGLSNDVTNLSPADSDSSSSSSSSAPTSSPTSSSSSVAPSVVTSVSPGNTVVVTVSASATSAPSGSGSGTSVAGIAAGVVIGVVVVAGLVGGFFFWLRHRRQRRAEEDYKQAAQVADFMRGSNERKAPGTGYSQMSDSRLDPEYGRRNSVGSMADAHDYSRRILRVANPDDH